MTDLKSLKSWKTGKAPNGEPVLILETHEGDEISIMMPGQAASDMGKALEQLGNEAAPPVGRSN